LNKSTILIIWLALLGVMTLVFNNLLGKMDNPNQELSINVNDYGQAEVVLKRNRYGHYVANGEINDQTVTFLVDTGATTVAVPQHIADRLGLKKGASFQSQTANGLSLSYQTNIDRLVLGGIEMRNVPASISTGMTFDEILLGMSFLKHLKIIQQDKELRLIAPL
jgi:aspartyl protease family protein